MECDNVKSAGVGANLQEGRVGSMAIQQADMHHPLLHEGGKQVATIQVSIGPRFLNLFSEQLYSSPNKAFEELVSNSWDAGATRVYIGIAEKLDAPEAVIWILDNGESMNIEGMQDLWAVATSQKRSGEPSPAGRHPIGKFGVGKLSTYLLAHELSYICKSTDGIIRSVSMDYRRIDGDPNKLHIDEVDLIVREITNEDLEEILAEVDLDGTMANRLDLLDESIEKSSPIDDEFGGDELPLPDITPTWTLALLTNLKGPGRKIQIGHVRRMLRSALPLGPSIRIWLNGEELLPSKTDAAVRQEWVLGVTHGFDSIELSDGEALEVVSKSAPFPHVYIEGMGRISGKSRLYVDKISGGKSDAIEASNGFVVNVLGRVLLPEDRYFGLSNLSHSTWSKFRATVRADGLDSVLSVNREGVAASRQLDIVRALLMKLFNIARNCEVAATKDEWPDLGEVLAMKWGTIPFQPLQELIDASFEDDYALEEMVDLGPLGEREALRKTWDEELRSNPESILGNVTVESRSSEDKMAIYEVGKRQLVVNGNHPFALEHMDNAQDVEILRDIALADTMSEAYLFQIGLGAIRLQDYREFRDQTLRLIARTNRRSAGQIAALLLEAGSNEKGLETIVGDALEFLGFRVERLGAPGEPEGKALADISSDPEDQDSSYSVTYDAKSTNSKLSRVQAKTVGCSTLQRHRQLFCADHSLVVAPDYSTGDSLAIEAEKCKVTPMRTADLGRLVAMSIGFGGFNLREFRSIFECHSPDSVSNWIEEFEVRLKQQEILPLNVLLDAVVESAPLEGDLQEPISYVQVSAACRRILGRNDWPKKGEVAACIRGLAMMAPNVVSPSSGNTEMILHAPANRIREVVRSQLRVVPASFRVGALRSSEALD